MFRVNHMSAKQAGCGLTLKVVLLWKPVGPQNSIATAAEITHSSSLPKINHTKAANWKFPAKF